MTDIKQMLLYGNLFKIPRRIFKYVLSFCYPIVKIIWPLPQIMSIEETILKIIEEECSISRFGDSEILYLVDKLNLPYQVYDENLASNLKKILNSDIPNLLVGLPTGYRSLNNMGAKGRVFWRSQISYAYPRLYKYINLKKVYYNANITRFYFGFENLNESKKNFNLIKKIWTGRKILLIEGEKSRLGVGNDLFSEALSVERILGPYHNAYASKNKLLAEAIKHGKDKLYLVAMGPTAKVITFELAQLGYQAVDIGNIDLEYEWFKRGKNERVKIEGKYTSEVKGGRVVSDIVDPLYQEQIIKVIS